jgi:hypothetical protein
MAVGFYTTLSMKGIACYAYSESCPCDHLYSTTSIQRPLGSIPKAGRLYISASINRPPPFKDLFFLKGNGDATH